MQNSLRPDTFLDDDPGNSEKQRDLNREKIIMKSSGKILSYHKNKEAAVFSFFYSC